MEENEGQEGGGESENGKDSEGEERRNDPDRWSRDTK